MRQSVLSELFLGMDYEKTDCIEPQFYCDCSKERLVKVLASLGKQELLDMIKTDHGANMHCKFCNKEYNFSEQELLDIICVLEEMN